MSFPNLKKREDRGLLIVGGVGVLLIAVNQAYQVGWWAFLTVPLTVALTYGIIMGLNAFLRRQRRKDHEDEIRAREESLGLPYEEPKEPQDSTWAKLWRSKRDR